MFKGRTLVACAEGRSVTQAASRRKDRPGNPLSAGAGGLACAGIAGLMSMSCQPPPAAPAEPSAPAEPVADPAADAPRLEATTEDIGDLIIPDAYGAWFPSAKVKGLAQDGGPV